MSTGMAPTAACHRRPVEERERPAACIEAILPYNADLEFDGMLPSYASGEMPSAEAMAATNAMLRVYDVPPVIKVTSRRGARPYVDYSHSVIIDGR